MQRDQNRSPHIMSIIWVHFKKVHVHWSEKINVWSGRWAKQWRWRTPHVGAWVLFPAPASDSSFLPMHTLGGSSHWLDFHHPVRPRLHAQSPAPGLTTVRSWPLQAFREWASLWKLFFSSSFSISGCLPLQKKKTPQLKKSVHFNSRKMSWVPCMFFFFYNIHFPWTFWRLLICMHFIFFVPK